MRITVLFISLMLLRIATKAQSFLPNSKEFVVNGQTGQTIGVTYGSGFVLYGNVVKLMVSRSTSDKKLKGDIILFNDKREATKIILGIDFSNNDYSCSKYFDKYNLNRKSIALVLDTTGKSFISSINKDGYIVAISYFNIDSVLVKTFAFNRDFLNNNLIEFVFYQDQNIVGLKETYKYNSNKCLSKINDYDTHGILQETVVFNYQTFDKHGNWTKRTETRKNNQGSVTGVVTTTRVITYYPYS